MTATGSSFVSDVTLTLDEGRRRGLDLGGAPVLVLPEGRGEDALLPVLRVGLGPAGQIVVLVSSALTPQGRRLAPGLILPPRLGGDVTMWGEGR